MIRIVKLPSPALAYCNFFILKIGFTLLMHIIVAIAQHTCSFYDLFALFIGFNLIILTYNDKW